MKILAFLIQPILLLAMLFYAYMPILWGKDVHMCVTGYDPRDFFRGNYVSLRYDFNIIESKKINETLDEKNWDVFAVLQQDGELYKTSHVSKILPQDELYIAGTRRYYSSSFGIESYFMPPKIALELEKTLTNTKFEAIAHLKILNGDARLVDINFKEIKNGEKNRCEYLLQRERQDLEPDDIPEVIIQDDPAEQDLTDKATQK